MKKIILNILLGMFSFYAIAQSEEILTNESVMNLFKLNMGNSIIVNKIQTSKSNFDVTTDALIKMKQAKLPDEIINAMLLAANQKSSTGSDSGSNDFNDPSKMHKSGIYYYNSETIDKKLIEIDPSTSSAVKSGGYFASAMSYGIAKVKRKASLSGRSALTRIIGSQPVFYFYFDKTKSNMDNLSSYNASAASPKEFILLKAVKKGNSREIEVGAANTFGSTEGIDDKDAIPFTIQKLSDGIYKVTPNSVIKPNEYCFVYTGNSTTSGGGLKVFDFGIDTFNDSNSGNK